MIRYLSVDHVLLIHSRLIAQTGGGQGIREIGLLESAVARPQMSFGRQLLYPTLFLQAAALLSSIVLNHPFIDGNKRTGITACGLFLRLNGWQLDTTNSELEQFVLDVVNKKEEVEAKATWLETHCIDEK